MVRKIDIGNPITRLRFFETGRIYKS